jgi:hypothetical protein
MAVERQRSGLRQLFTEHPRSLGMTWASHGAGAAKIGLELLGASVACFVHALVPGWFTETAGKKIVDLSDHIKRRRKNAANPEHWSDYDI